MVISIVFTIHSNIMTFSSCWVKKLKKTFRIFLSGGLFVVLFLICSVCAADIDKAYSFGAPGWTPLVGNWNAGSYYSIGVTNGQMWYLDTNGDGTFGPGDNVYSFGLPDWLSVVGDWNGDRKTEIGVYKDGSWYLDMNGNGAFDSGDSVYSFGLPGWLPVVGDWDGDGKTEIGVYKDGSWYLDVNGDGEFGPGDNAYSFGLATWSPVIGDWNGDGKTEIGVYKDGSWYLDVNGNGAFGPGDNVNSFGLATWSSVIGNWDGLGKTEIGIYKDGSWYLDVNGDGAFGPGDNVNSFGLATWSSVIGDWNGDGKTEIGVYKDGSWYLDYDGSGAWTTSTATNPTAAFTSNVCNGTAPLMVMFSDQSTGTGPLTYAWDFTNDGVIDSTIQSPSFTYATAGTYSVNLTVTNGAGSDSELKTGYITINPALVIPTAAFTSNKQTGTAPLTVAFTDQSTGTGPLTYAWDFTNEGNDESNLQNPSFTYSAAGTYTVKLTVTNAAGSDEEQKTGFITVSAVPVAPTAAFTSNKQAGTAPLTVRFTDQTTGTAPLTYAWDFTNDGVNDSTTKNPSFTYSAAGTYTVRLTATNAAGSDAEIKTGYITISPAPVAPTAAFTSDKQSGMAPLTVTFTNQSSGTAPLTYAWDFKNDGTVDSSEPSPTYIYTTPGTYTVKLTVTNVAGSDEEQKTGYITVTAVPVAPTAAFTSNKQTGNTPLTVTFTDQSTGTPPLSYDWDFNNDRITDSTIKSPFFIYDTAGTYTVNLTVTNSLGSDSELKTSYITVNPTIAPHAAFTSDVQSGDAPMKVKFTDQSTGTTPLTYAWDFNNDGTTDNTTQSPSFTYITAGTYTVKLTVTNGAGSDVRTEPDYIIVNVAPPSSHVGVAITFDDNYVDQWYAIRDILNRNNAHVTFFVSNFASLDQDQINKLKTLQADGHEIAFHGYNHEDAVVYLQSHTVTDYMNNEIYRGVDLMKSNGFNPVDFAYPYGYDDPAATQALEGYFDHVRDTAYSWDDAIYYQYGSNQFFIAGIGMDDVTYGNSMTDIYDGISRAKTEDKILIFYGHEPVAGDPGMYQTSYTRLENMLKFVSDNNLKTFTVSELH